MEATDREKEGCPADLRCPVCGHAVWDPVMHGAPCGAMMCRECAPASCPACREATSGRLEAVVLRPVLQRLSTLLVFCNNCSDFVSRASFADHRAHCPVPCPLCSQRVAPADAQAHEAACPARSVPCSARDVLCPWSGPRADVAAHVAGCPFVAMRAGLAELLRRDQERREEIARLQEGQSHLIWRLIAGETDRTGLVPVGMWSAARLSHISGSESHVSESVYPSVWTASAHGHCVYGPYAQLAAGHYTALFRVCRVNSGPAVTPFHSRVVLDAFSGRPLAEARVNITDALPVPNQWRCLAVDFDHPGGVIETRVFTSGPVPLAVDMTVICRPT